MQRVLEAIVNLRHRVYKNQIDHRTFYTILESYRYCLLIKIMNQFYIKINGIWWPAKQRFLYTDFFSYSYIPKLL